MRRLIAVMVITGALVCAMAVQAQEYELRYVPARDFADKGKLKAELLDITYEGTPMGFAGIAEAVYEVEVTDIEGETTELKIRASDIQAESMGQVYTIKAAPAVTLTVDQLGRVLESEAEGKLTLPGFTIGKGPLQMLTMVLSAGHFPEAPIPVGQTWELEGDYSLPDLGETSLHITSTLEAVEGEVAVIKSLLELTVPDFEAPSPIVPDQQIQYTEGHVVVSDLVWHYDMSTSHLLKVSGKVAMTFIAVFPDLPASIGVEAEFELVSDALEDTE